MKPRRLPAEPKPETLTAVVDTREDESHRLDLSPLKVSIGTLTTGDYSIVGSPRGDAGEKPALVADAFTRVEAEDVTE